MAAGMFGKDFMNAIYYGDSLTEHQNTERAARNGKKQTKGQDKNKHQHGREHQSKKYEYSNETDAINELLQIIKDKDSKIETLEKRNEDKDSTIEMLEKRNEEKNSNIETLEKRNEDKDFKIETLEKRNEYKDSKIETLKKRNDDKDSKIETLEKRNKDKDSKIETLEKRNEDKYSKIETLEKRNENKDSKIETLEKGNEDKDSKLETLEKRNEDKDSKIETLEKRNKDKDSKIETLEKRNKDKDSKIETLEKGNVDKDSKIETLEKRNKEHEKRSMKIAKVMAEVMETKGGFENDNDGLGNMNVTERFSKLYDEDWVNLSKWLTNTYSATTELDVIRSLTDLMRNGYRECLQLSHDQIRQFLFLDESQGIPTFVKHPEVYAVRKTFVQTETKRTEVKRVVLEKILPADKKSTFYVGDKSQETERRLQEFLRKYLDCCWLMIVSVPPISLNFDLVGSQYCKEHFTTYSCKKPVEDETKENDTVYEVVWPCVCLQDGSAFYQKGDVVVVTNGMVKKDKLGNTECSCLSIEVCDSRATLNARVIQENPRADEGKSFGNQKIKPTGRSKPRNKTVN